VSSRSSGVSFRSSASTSRMEGRLLSSLRLLFRMRRMVVGAGVWEGRVLDGGTRLSTEALRFSVAWRAGGKNAARFCIVPSLGLASLVMVVALSEDSEGVGFDVLRATGFGMRGIDGRSEALLKMPKCPGRDGAEIFRCPTLVSGSVVVDELSSAFPCTPCFAKPIVECQSKAYGKSNVVREKSAMEAESREN
jgi:hypothetical protein